MKVIRSRAPLRLGLAGGGSDVSPYSDKFGGNILNVTISLYSYCTIESINENEIIIDSVDLKETEFFPNGIKHFKLNGKLDLIKQVLNHLLDNKYISEFSSFKLTSYCDAPPGSGLGTSSTMVVAVLKAIFEWKNLSFNEYDLAHMAYLIERKDLGLAGGKQDQYSAAFGGFNFIEFHKNNSVLVNPLRIKKWIINELSNSMLIFNLGSSRSSAKIINEQKKSISKNNESLEAMHQIKSHAKKMKEYLLKGEFQKISDLLNLSWEMKKKLSNKVSNERINKVYSKALECGAKSGKISGAGGGGTLMLIINPTKKNKIISELEKMNCKHLDFVFTTSGCYSWKIK